MVFTFSVLMAVVVRSASPAKMLARLPSTETFRRSMPVALDASDVDQSVAALFAVALMRKPSRRFSIPDRRDRSSTNLPSFPFACKGEVGVVQVTAIVRDRDLVSVDIGEGRRFSVRRNCNDGGVVGNFVPFTRNTVVCQSGIPRRVSQSTMAKSSFPVIVQIAQCEGLQ